MADSLVGLDSGGCVTPIANGSVGQVLAIGAGGTPVWTAAATDDQVASEVAYESPPAGTPLAIGTVEGALDTIAPCLCCSVIGDNTSADGGIGAPFMVRSAVKALDGTLGLNGAPEHYSVTAQFAAPFNNKNIISTQVVGNTMQTINGSITNPSACRDMNYIVIIAPGAASYVITGDIIEDMKVTINGPAGVLENNNWATSMSLEAMPNTMQVSPQFGSPTYVYSGTLAPGATAAYDFTLVAITRLFNMASGVPGINPACAIYPSTMTFLGSTTT